MLSIRSNTHNNLLSTFLFSQHTTPLSDTKGDPFFQPFYFHWFGDTNKVVEDGTVETVSEDSTVTSEFNAERIFLNPDYWDYDPEY